MAKNLEKTAQKILGFAGIKINGNSPEDIKIHNPRVYERILTEGSLGLAESYMDGDWDCQRLDVFFYKILKERIDEKALEGLNFKTKIKLLAYRIKSKVFNLQNISRSKIVGKKHYDTGNYLFEKMLDRRMQYSCGYFKNAKTLDEAQEAKLDLICKKINLKPGMKVLDIGCGFGGFAKYAAEKYKVKVIGVTISEAQAIFAKKFCRGLDVEIRVQDYREISEKFDRIVSIGMFEHVGFKNYINFFTITNKLLKEDGLFLLHTIGKNTSEFSADPFIMKYIFSGGELPSLSQITKAVEESFVVLDVHSFGGDYDKTLIEWNKNFKENWNTINKNDHGKYDNRFKRMWEYYLLCCAGAFRVGNIQLWQIVLSKPLANVNYQSIR
ncbi:MAG: cyclopropane fatty acyl phospholipid synthase [Candidatus Pacearchaeota archaeon]|jgi:cyclopropane-fatty-acyl-phospholipid synthase